MKAQTMTRITTPNSPALRVELTDDELLELLAWIQSERPEIWHRATEPERVEQLLAEMERERLRVGEGS